MDINKEFEKLVEEFEKEWHDGHEPQGIDDQYVEEMEDEEVEEARTYLDRKDDDEKDKKKKGITPMSQKKKRWGSSGYGKGEEVEDEDEAYGGTKKWKKGQNKMKKSGITLQKKDKFSGYVEKVEEVEIDELVALGKKSATGYTLYHKDFSSAMQHAYDHAKKKGHVVDPKEIDDKVATGPKKPSKGKVNRYALKAGRKTVQIQVTNLDNKAYELNMYIEGLEESRIGTGDQESRALIATKAKMLMKQALKSGKKQSQDWWNKQAKLAGLGEDIEEGIKDLPPHLQKLIKKIEKKQKDWNKQNPEAKIQTLVYNPETGKPDIEIKEKTMNLKDTILQVATGKSKLEEHCGVCDEHGIEEDSDKEEPGTQGDMAVYQKKRKEVAKKFGVKSCSELEGSKKKECFSALDKAHVADHEEQVELKKMQKEEKKEQQSFSKVFSQVKNMMKEKKKKGNPHY